MSAHALLFSILIVVGAADRAADWCRACDLTQHNCRCPQSKIDEGHCGEARGCYFTSNEECRNHDDVVCTEGRDGGGASGGNAQCSYYCEDQGAGFGDFHIDEERNGEWTCRNEGDALLSYDACVRAAEAWARHCDEPTPGVSHEHWDGPRGCHVQVGRGGMDWQYNRNFEGGGSPDHTPVCRRECIDDWSPPAGTTYHGVGDKWCKSELDAKVGDFSTPDECWNACVAAYGEEVQAIQLNGYGGS